MSLSWRVSRRGWLALTAVGTSLRRITGFAFAQEACLNPVPGRPNWQQTAMRVKDPKESMKFYVDQLGFTVLDTFDFPQYGLGLTLLSAIPSGEKYGLKPGTKASHTALCNREDVALELMEVYDTDKSLSYHPGNADKDGYGHVSVVVNDLQAYTDKLLNAGYSKSTAPKEGGNKDLTFFTDPDGYLVELIQRRVPDEGKAKTNFAQTALRVKDPAKSLEYYHRLGMKLIFREELSDCTYYFLVPDNVPEGAVVEKPTLKLIHVHGKESDPEFQYYSGNEDDRLGFGHIGFLVDDVFAACDAIRPFGYGFAMEPHDEPLVGIGFAKDPDGYWVEIIPRGGMEFGDVLQDA